MIFGIDIFGDNFLGGSTAEEVPILPGEYECVSIVDATKKLSISGLQGNSIVDATEKLSISSVCREKI